MNSVTTQQFRKCYQKLPQHIQEKVKKSYKNWSANPFHPSIQFKQIHPVEPIYSVRIDIHYRALGVKQSKVMIWFWVGTHEEYNNLIAEI